MRKDVRLCQRCNWCKGPNLSGVDPDTGRIVNLFQPRQDRWEDHFEFLGDRIRAKNAIGRATTWLLEMNSDERVRWRRTLREHGLF